MQIQPSHVSPVPRLSTARAAKPTESAPTLEPTDSVRVGGSIGAMAGALTARPLLVLGAGLALGTLGSALLGLPGALALGAAGLYGGFKLESATKVGRLVGGMIGGVAGSVAGRIGHAFGFRPSQELATECKGFSVGSLPKKLLNPHYTSHPKLSAEIAKDGAAHAQPGDIIITNDDGDFKFEIAQKLMGLVAKGPGVAADWTHFYTVGRDKTVVDILLGAGGPTKFPVEHAFTDNTKAKILRPQYTSPEAREKTLDWVNSQFGKVDYDTKFSLKSDDRLYCQEYGWKAFRHGDPSLAMEPSSIGIGKHKWEFLTADNFDHSPHFKEVWSTGSNFWINWLSHFN